METWSIWYIDESFLIWIISTMYQSHESGYWARTTGLSHLFSHYLMPYSCSGVYAHDTVFNVCFWLNLSIHVCFSCTPLSNHHTIPRGVSDSIDLHVQILELKPWWTSSWSEWRSGSIVDQWKTSPRSYPSKPLCSSSSFPFITREYILYYSSLYISFYSRIYAYQWCNIHVILCHILW